MLYFDPTTGTYKFMGELNVGDKFVVDREGNVTLSGNINLSRGVITWGGNGPVQYQFSPSPTGPWHGEMQTNDKYRRDSLDGGTSWGKAYQFRGTDGSDGADGSDARVPEYITETGITKTDIRSPKITGGLLEGGEVRVTGEFTSDYAGRSELGVYDTGGSKFGYIRYDDQGAGTPEEAKHRMFIATERDKALKIQSGGNMSLSCTSRENTIYFGSRVVFGVQPDVYAKFA